MFPLRPHSTTTEWEQVREAAKELHEFARSSGPGSVAGILRASAARTSDSLSFAGEAPRATLSSSGASSWPGGNAHEEADVPASHGPATRQHIAHVDSKVRTQSLDQGGDTESGACVEGEHRDRAAVAGDTVHSDASRRSRQWSVLAKRLAYVVLAVSVVVSGVVYATDGDFLALAAEKMDRGTGKGELRRTAEMKAATLSKRQIHWK